MQQIYMIYAQRPIQQAVLLSLHDRIILTGPRFSVFGTQGDTLCTGPFYNIESQLAIIAIK